MSKKQYSIKPLKWEKPYKGFYRDTTTNFYTITKRDDKYEVYWCFAEYYDEGGKTFDTVAKAKRFAAKDWKERMEEYLDEV